MENIFKFRLYQFEPFALDPELKSWFVRISFDILRPVVTCPPCAGCIRWQEAAWLIKEWTVLQTPLTHSWFCLKHHSYNTCAHESFPSVSLDIEGPCTSRWEADGLMHAWTHTIPQQPFLHRVIQIWADNTFNSACFFSFSFLREIWTCHMVHRTDFLRSPTVDKLDKRGQGLAPSACSVSRTARLITGRRSHLAWQQLHHCLQELPAWETHRSICLSSQTEWVFFSFISSFSVLFFELAN